jgi:hypothetical protein
MSIKNKKICHSECSGAKRRIYNNNIFQQYRFLTLSLTINVRTLFGMTVIIKMLIKNKKLSIINKNTGQSFLYYGIKKCTIFSPIICLYSKILLVKYNTVCISYLILNDFKCCSKELNDYLKTALPGGNSWSGSFNNVANNGNWWSATEYDATNAWNRNLNYSMASVNRNNNNKANGFSVRCLKD